MKKQLFVLTALALLLPACGNKAPESEAFPELKYSVEMVAKGDGVYTVTDAIGRKVDVKPGTYRRVVCIGAGALRLYSYIGDISALAGVEDIDNINAGGRPMMFDNVARPYVLAGEEVFNELPSCGKGGPQAQTAEPEKILACNPDIVISEYEDADKEDALQEQLGVPVITLKYGNGVMNEKLYSTLYMLGSVFGKKERAEDLINYHYNSLKQVFDATKNVSQKKKAYICGLGNWGTTNQFMTSSNFETFQIAHVDNVAKDLALSGIQAIKEEQFLSLAPSMDVMIFDAAAVKNIKGKEYDFSSCAAFKTGEVYLQMAYNAYYTNVETALANTWFTAKSVYPDLFKTVDIEAKTNEITLKFNGAELYSRIKDLKMSYGGYQKIANPTEFFR